jgi:hypothetical protein
MCEVKKKDTVPFLFSGKINHNIIIISNIKRMYSNVEKSQYLMLVDFSIKKSSNLCRMEIQTGKTLDLFFLRFLSPSITIK